MQIKVKWREGGPDLNMEKAGVAIQEGCLAVYPEINKADCDMYPLDLIKKIEIREDVEAKPSNITDIRRGN